MKDLIETPYKIQGKKQKLVDFIIDTMVKSHIKFDNFVEPFFGTGAVGFNVVNNIKNIENSIFSDINKYIIGFYKLVRGISIEEIEEHLRNFSKELKEKGETYYYEVRRVFNERHSGKSVPDLLNFLCLNRCCFNGLSRFNQYGEFNVPYCKNDSKLTDKLIENILDSIKKIKNIIRDNNIDFRCESYKTLLNEIPNNSLIYCDPPYIKRNNTYYNKEWDLEDEIDLREKLVASNTKFMVSNWLADSKGNINETVKKVWGDFNIKYTPAHNYIVGAKSTKRFQVTEVLITNF